MGLAHGETQHVMTLVSPSSLILFDPKLNVAEAGYRDIELFVCCPCIYIHSN